MDGMDLRWWIAVIAVPVVGGLVSAMMNLRTKQAESAKAIHIRIDAVQKELSDYKVSAAMLFAQVALVREVKDDVMKVLDRIENRLTGIEEDMRSSPEARR